MSLISIHSQLAQLTSEKIIQVLDITGQHLPEADDYPAGFFSTAPRHASVLIPMYKEKGEWFVLFIRRSEHEDDRHSGQVAFPGGKVDEGDYNARAAALREAQEEIGLQADQVTVLGHLRDYQTISNYRLTPVVAKIEWPTPLKLDSREVSKVFSIPLSWLANPANFTIGWHNLEGWNSRVELIHYQRFQGELLWGITAKLTVSLLHLLGLGCR
ncbi:MAG: CoA pyrophosphatase [Pseudomonadota bacterium]